MRLDQATELGMLIPSKDNFPGPYTHALHNDCDMRTWKLIDEDHVAKASDKLLSHVDFAGGFADVKLGHSRTFRNTGRLTTAGNPVSKQVWRVFYEVRESQ